MRPSQNPCNGCSSSDNPGRAEGCPDEAIEKRRPTGALSSEDNQVRPGPFVSVEELLQIKGITRSTLYGTHQQEGEKTIHKRGLVDFVTVHSGSQRINVNSAEAEMLASLPGMDWVRRHLLCRHDRKSHLSK